MQRVFRNTIVIFLGLTAVSAVQAQKPVLVKPIGPTNRPVGNPIVAGNQGPVIPSNPGGGGVSTVTPPIGTKKDQPDLGVTDVSITALGNNKYQYVAHIANLSKAPYPSSNNRQWSAQVTYDGRLDGGERGQQVTTLLIDGGQMGNLPAGQSMRISSIFTETAQFGTINCTVRVSPGDANLSNDSKFAVLVIGN
jgi:hypothetical protein